MKKTHLLSALATFSAGIYLLNTWAKRRGATADEAVQTLPGEEIVPCPMIQTTHAVTIAATPEQVWPWIVQMGYYRAGWYTDNDYWWDRLADRYLRLLVRREASQSGAGYREQPSVGQIVPEWQQLAVGDEILDGPPDTAYFTVSALEPNRLLALHSDTHLRYFFPAWLRENPSVGIAGEFSWVFLLRSVAADRTRLILRTRATIRPWWYRAFAALFFPSVGAVLELTMLHAIKARAEQRDRSLSTPTPAALVNA